MIRKTISWYDTLNILSHIIYIIYIYIYNLGVILRFFSLNLLLRRPLRSPTLPRTALTTPLLLKPSSNPIPLPLSRPLFLPPWVLSRISTIWKRPRKLMLIYARPVSFTAPNISFLVALILKFYFGILPSNHPLLQILLLLGKTNEKRNKNWIQLHSNLVQSIVSI